MAKAKNFTITIDPEQIVGSEIMKSKDYRYARLGVKRGENEFMTVSYEWKGDIVPDFVMSLMSWMQSSIEAIEKNEEEFAALKERM
jgi:hypothetical protein